MSSKPVGHLNSLDGQMTAADSAFVNLRVWRDLNQNGLSEAGELSTLTSLNITAINVAANSHTITVSNGNLITDQGSYTRGDGTVGTAGEIANNSYLDAINFSLTATNLVLAMNDAKWSRTA
ncbi:MAG: hypothetical protein IPN81_01595 [Nitrosomonadales bacterium]|nr:hypothetical protein [Nitrosomonadales bacterium]